MNETFYTLAQLIGKCQFLYIYKPLSKNCKVNADFRKQLFLFLFFVFFLWGDGGSFVPEGCLVQDEAPYTKRQQDNAGNECLSESLLFYCYALLTRCSFSCFIEFWRLSHSTPSVPLHQSSCPCEIYHKPNLLIGEYFSRRWQGGIDKRHKAKRCVLLFHSISLWLFLTLGPFCLLRHPLFVNSWYPRQPPLTPNTEAKWTLL